MTSYKAVKILETKTMVASLCDGIVRLLFKKDSEISVEDIKENYKTINELVEEKYFSFLYSTESDNIIYTPETLKYSKKIVVKRFQKFVWRLLLNH